MSSSGLSEPSAPPVRLSDIAARTGLSKTKLRDDVHRGYLRVRWVQCGSRKMALVMPGEVTRYLRAIGILHPSS